MVPEATPASMFTAASVLGHAEVWTFASSLILAILIGAFLLSSVGIKRAASGTATAAASLVEFDEEDFLSMGMPEQPHLEGGFQPPNRLIHSNSAEAFDFDNENCKGQFLPLHRPTYDSRLNESGQYRYGERLWELRLRLQFKRHLNQSDLFFAAELEEYVPLSAATKRVMDLSVGGMRQVVGDRLYHTAGDPTEVVGERERPTIAMPLWTFDQFIETPEGETPPELTDPNLHEHGHKRYGQLREYRRMVDSLDLRPGPTFTFCFWGVSRFCDVIEWQATGIPIFTPLDLNLYCGKPPLHLVLYTLAGAGEEKRHLQSRKTYFFRCGFWSSLKRPSKEVVTYFAGRSIELLRRRASNFRRKNSGNPAGSGVEIFGLNVFQCCGDANDCS
ncbi:unnamed protein product [Symbiodinium sp. CCMP2592]|nr:unnamed protein product [Symbiodinium sp. CCMP2592]